MPTPAGAAAAFDAAQEQRLAALDAVLATPDTLLSDAPAVAAAARDAAQALYASLNAAAGAVPLGDALPELYTDGFDAEQIWRQIELRLGPVLKRVSRALKAADRAGGESLLPGVPADSDADVAGGDDSDAEDDADDVSDGDGDDDAADEEGEEDEEMDDEEDEFAQMRAAAKGRAPKAALLPTEDAFFRLGDMERFVQDAEEAEAAGAAGAADDEDGEEGDDDSDDDVDLFAPGSDDDGGGGGGGAGGSSDDDLDAVVAFSSGLTGGAGKAAAKGKHAAAAAKAKAAKAKRGGAGGDGIMYEDFFGPRPGKRAAGDEDGWGDAYRAGPCGGDDGDDDVVDDDAPGSGEEEEEDEEEEEMDGDGGAGDDLDGMPAPRDMEPASRRAPRRSALLDSDSDGGGEGDGGGAQSAHARRAAKLAAQIAKLEAANIGEKAWHMRGEARGGDRPLNSALELALDFEHAQAPPPVITAEATKNLEELIRSRCAEGRFDDVERRLPPEPGRKRKEVVLNDEKSTKGLGELYEEEYLKERAAAEAAAAAAAALPGGAPSAAAAAAAQEDDTPLAREARGLFAALCSKLDALSHFQFAPKPLVADLEVTKKDIPALAVEEVAPAAVSTAALRAPQEVYAGGVGAGKAAGGARGSAAGRVLAEAELSREERKARRARKKRKGMGAAAEKEEKRARLARQRDAAEAAAVAAGFKPKEARPSQRAAAPTGARSEFAKSSKVFGALQDSADAAKAAAAAGGGEAAAASAAKRLKDKVKANMGGGFRAAALKL